MAKGPMQSVIHHIRGLVVAQDAAALADSVLLERFLTRRDEAAFEALVRRHGPMVLGVCRRVLSNPHDAEDAFQATFLVFVRKAASIAKRELLGNWLYGVAYHTARAARSAADGRRAKEARVVPRQQPPEESALQELRLLLDQELSRLPDKYRIPVVLCELEGKSRRNVAQELGLPEGTLSSRLARARAILARRLARRGLTLSGGALAAGLGQPATAAVLPCPLVLATVKAGTLVLAGQSATAGVVSAYVAALTEGVMKTMFLAKLKIATAGLFAGSALIIGMGTVASRQLWATSLLPGKDGRAQATTARAEGDLGNQQPPSSTSSPDAITNPLLQQAREIAGTITDPLAKLHILLRIAAVQRETGDPSGAGKTRQDALELAKTLPTGRAQVSALQTVAFAHADAQDRNAAWETLRQAEQLATTIQDAHEKGNSLSNLVMRQSQLEDYQGALRTAAQAADFQISALRNFTWFVKKESGPAGRKALNQAFEMAKSSPSPVNKRETLIAIAVAQVRLGDPAAALQIADTLDGREKSLALEPIAIAQAKGADVEGALRTMIAIQGDESRANVLQAVAVAQGKAGDAAAAQTTLEEVRQIADKLQNDPRLRGTSRLRRMASVTRLRERLAVTQVRLGDIGGALQTASALESDYEKAKALLEIGTAQEAAGKRADARETLLRAARAAENIKRGTGNDSPAGPSGPSESAKAATMRQIAEQQAKAGDIQEALRTVENIPTRRETDTALAGIVRAQAQAGDVKGGLETLARIKDEEDKVFVLEDLVQAQMKAGDEGGALALAARQTSPSLKAHALLAIASGKVKQPATKK